MTRDQVTREALHALIVTVATLLGGEVLVDALGAEADHEFARRWPREKARRGFATRGGLWLAFTRWPPLCRTKPDSRSTAQGTVRAFEFFGGIFRNVRFDNLTPAVRKALKGRDREIVWWGRRRVFSISWRSDRASSDSRTNVQSDSLLCGSNLFQQRLFV